MLLVVVVIVMGVILGDYGLWYFVWFVGIVMIVLVVVVGGVWMDVYDEMFEGESGVVY